MILYYYTDIDSLERILAYLPMGKPCIRLEASHRSALTDDPQNIFGNYLLPRCLQSIEDDLGVKTEDSLLPLINNRQFMEAVYLSNKTFDDRGKALSQFVVSFYESMDQLDLWNRYAKGSNGISIGFDTDLLKKPFGQVFNYSMRKCLYWSCDILKNGYWIAQDNPLYEEVKTMYATMTDSRITESFKRVYSQDVPDAVVTRQIKETLLRNLIMAFDLFQKSGEWRDQNEHRMTISTVGAGIHYHKDDNGDYVPFTYLEFPIDALKIIMIGPMCGRYSYGMVRSLLFERGISQPVQVLNSNCLMWHE